jgi:hypothetical protein
MLCRLSIIILLQATLTGTAKAESQDNPDAWRAAIAELEAQFGARVEIKPPDGEYYEATVPDTLDLGKRGSLALNCLLGMVAGPEHDFEAYRIPVHEFRGASRRDVAQPVPARRRFRRLHQST